MKRFLFTILLMGAALLSSPFLSAANAAEGEPDDVIARVGDQPITLGEIDVMINSSAMIGISTPLPGTPERNTARLTVLDKLVSANLIYLDALQKGLDKNPVYQDDVARFSDATLALLYKHKFLVGEIEVSDKDIMEFYENNIAEGTPFTKDLALSIEATIRKQRFKARTAGMRERLRKGIKVEIDESKLDPEKDLDRSGATVVARIDEEALTWGKVRSVLSTPKNAGSMENRLKALNRIIDERIMIKKAKAAGLEQDPAHLARVEEFKKVRLINLHRSQLVEEMEPSAEELEVFFEENRDRITVKESRKVQMVVLPTKAEAEEIKQKIDAGDITVYEAAMEYSIDPNAKKTLGEIGWVSQGTGFPKLDELTFSLPPNQLGGPVQSPAGWHLVKVLEVQVASFENIEDSATQRKARRMFMKKKMDDYVVKLRKNEFPVVFYEDVFQRLIKKEMEKVKVGSGATSGTARAATPPDE